LRRARNISARKSERGIVILIVAVVLLFVVGAMAALSIDVVTFYTARSEAQLAADGAALAGARVLANSGMTSDLNANTDGLLTTAENLATTIALRVGGSNDVGGRTLRISEITVSFNDTAASFLTNPNVTVHVARTDIPTFFARIWGSATVTVRAIATAEAYNPSGVDALRLPVIPVAPTCVKPWVLPNLNPIDGSSTIIDPSTGAINTTPGILVTRDISGTPLESVCARSGSGRCSLAGWFPGTPAAWKFYPGDPSSFPTPTVVPSCVASATAYEKSVAGCMEVPIACGSTINLDSGALGTFHQRTADAANCISHAASNGGDSIDTTAVPPSGPYQFLTGADNPVVLAGTLAANTDTTVSDSIVTLPIFDQSTLPSTLATVIGFVQVFLNSDGMATANSGSTDGQIKTEVINVVGCKNGVTGQAILGNGSSPVAVRLITP